jgi:hypothetical protein
MTPPKKKKQKHRGRIQICQLHKTQKGIAVTHCKHYREDKGIAGTVDIAGKKGIYRYCKGRKGVRGIAGIARTKGGYWR